MKSINLVIIALFMSLSTVAQQQVSYSQYMFNGMAINPAYIGTNDGLSFTGLSRWQWLGLEGAPVTQTFAVNAALPNNNSGIGIQFINDEISVSNNTSVMLGYAYRIGLAGGYLHFGLQGGINHLRTNLSSVYTLGNDPTFAQDVSTMKPNFGTGLFYYNSVFYLGLSAPSLINNSLKYQSDNIYTQRRHYFATSGVMIRLSEGLGLKPNILLKVVEGAPVSIDYNINLLIREVIWVGVSYRAPESVSFLTEVKINQAFRVGYAYDHIIDQTLSTQATSSHEIMLDYSIRWNKSRIVTPRYF